MKLSGWFNPEYDFLPVAADGRVEGGQGGSCEPGEPEQAADALFRNTGSESPSPADSAMIDCQLLNRMDHCNYMSLLIFTVTTRMCQPHKVCGNIYEVPQCR